MSKTSPFATSLALSPLRPLLETWVTQSNQRIASAPPVGDAWWMSPTERTGSFLEAAKCTGWSTRYPIAPEVSTWDMHLEQKGRRYAVRCVGAMQSIAGGNDGRQFLASARRVARAAQSAKNALQSETGLQILFVIPYVPVGEGEDDRVAHLLDQWLANQPLRAAAHAWVGAATPLLRNAAGWAFPGLGLLLQPLGGGVATS